MTSIARKQNKKWKGVKWIDTPFAKRNLWLKIRAYRAMCAVPLAQAVSQICAIRSTKADPAKKAAAIAETVIAGHQASMQIAKKFKYIIN